MTDSEFKARPKEELLTAAKEAQRNAQQIFSVAQQAASSSAFGVANSLLILSVEECIKSAILTAGYFDIPLPFDIKPYFKDHETKHSQAAELQPVINFIWGIRNAYLDILRNRKSAYGTVFNLALTNLFASIGFHIGNKPVRNFDAWWKKANDQKNNGLYVGFISGKWNFPTAISEETFLETLAMAKPFVECLEIVQELRVGDNLLFAQSKEFTREEIDASEIKLTPVSPENAQQNDFSEYKPANNKDD